MRKVASMFGYFASVASNSVVRYKKKLRIQVVVVYHIFVLNCKTTVGDRDLSCVFACYHVDVWQFSFMNSKQNRKNYKKNRNVMTEKKT